MSEYFAYRSFKVDEQIAPRPNGPAIEALLKANAELEKANPQPERVPAFDMDVAVEPQPKTSIESSVG